MSDGGGFESQESVNKKSWEEALALSSMRAGIDWGRVMMISAVRGKNMRLIQ